MENELSKRIEFVSNMRLALIHNGIISFENIINNLPQESNQYIKNVISIKGYTQITIQTNNLNTIKEFINSLFFNLIKHSYEDYIDGFDYSSCCTIEKYSDNIYIIRI